LLLAQVIKMTYKIFSKNNICYFLRPLEYSDIDYAVSLCDKYVGENMYSKEYLADVVNSSDKFFYMLTTTENKIIGYIFFYLTDKNSNSESETLYRELTQHNKMMNISIIGKLQSIGIDDEFRGNEIALNMMKFAVHILQSAGAEILLGVCWKINKTVPMKKIMDELEFLHLCDIENFWFDNESLNCPHCGGRCRCEASVYYKIYKGETKNETSS